MIDLETRLIIKKNIKAINKFQYRFITTFYAMGFLIPYLVPYSIREIKETNVKDKKFTNAENIGAYSGLLSGLGAIIIQGYLYNEYGIERENYWLLAIPVITNLASGIKEYKRKNGI